MREVKFRAKRLDNGEWVYGSYVNGKDSDGPNESGEYTHYIISAEKGKWSLSKLSCIMEGLWYEVDPSTIGQYTGLKDKNGRDIYEGDVLQTHFQFGPGDAGYGISQEPFIVKWVPGRTAFRAFKPDKNGLHLLDVVDFFEVQSSLYEVIGNIHDNPELLEPSTGE